MSAIAAILGLAGSRHDPAAELLEMLSRLSVYGEPQTLAAGPGALGSCSRREGAQPGSHALHYEPRLEVAVAFDGRLDDRPALRARLGDDAPPASASDAALVASAFARWREEAFARLVGPFALVLFEPGRRQVFLARDPLGDRGLVWSECDGALLAATEESALLAHPGVDRTLDETTLARHFALLDPAPRATFFRSVCSVPPGTWIRFSPEGSVTGSTGSFVPFDARGASEADLVEELRARLAAAVACRLDPGLPPAILMSGGMDSTSVAATAAELVSAASVPGPARSFSWFFPKTPRADERRFQQPVVEALRLDARWIDGDATAPALDPERWPTNPNTPADIPLRALHESAYQAARSAGVRGLLTGEFGDHLWVGGADWLLSLLDRRRWWAALEGLAAHTWHQGLLREPTAVPLRLALSRVARRSASSANPRALPPWLTPVARRLVESSRREEPVPDHAPRLAALLDPAIPEGRRAERRWAARYGIELRAPFRDRRLLELALGLPAEMLHRPGWSKLALRRAMQSRLPEVTRTRRWLSTQYPIVREELAVRSSRAFRALFREREALCAPFVDRRFLETSYPGAFAAAGSTAEGALLWRCLAAERWRRDPLATAASTG